MEKTVKIKGREYISAVNKNHPEILIALERGTIEADRAMYEKERMNAVDKLHYEIFRDAFK